MSRIPKVTRAVLLSSLAVIATTAFSDERPHTDPGGPLTGPPVVGAPFIADATTFVRQRVDGGTIERLAKARYYRDSEGRVRVEQMMPASQHAKPRSEQVRITVSPRPWTYEAYVLDPARRTAQLGPRDIAGIAAGGGETFAVPTGDVRFLVIHRPDAGPSPVQGRAIIEPLGTRIVAGVQVTGQRITVTHASGPWSAEPEIVQERWESPELKLLISGQLTGSRISVEYRLTNIRREEPTADLVSIPDDYIQVGYQGRPWISLDGYPKVAASARRTSSLTPSR